MSESIRVAPSNSLILVADEHSDDDREPDTIALVA